MAIFRAIVFSAVLAGLIVGGLVTALQHLGAVPLILQAEVFEQQARTAGHAHDAATAHMHEDDEGWAPADGLERNAYTALFNLVEWIGFGLLLNGAFVLRGRSVAWREGLFWGLGGFAAFVIAPGLGLPPELPGVPAADLLARQAWWIGTVAATVGGLAAIAFGRSWWLAASGVLLLMLPHLIGAPHLASVATNVPEALSHRFIVATTLTGLLSWSLLGSLSGQFFRRFAGEGTTMPAAFPAADTRGA
jgi:cobalt transporter subunit CbtA